MQKIKINNIKHTTRSNKKSMKFTLSLIIALFFCCSGEKFKSYYPTLEDARRDGALKRGWIPKILPSSTKSIIEHHNIDTNDVWIKFNADTIELKTLLDQLRTLNKQEIDSLFPFKYPGKWWMPRDSTRYSFKIAAYNYDLNRADGKNITLTGYFFLDIKNSTGYYFCPQSE